MIEAGLVTWCLLIGLNAALLGFLRERFSEYPYLSAYLAYRLLRSLVIFPLFYAGDMTLYSRMYWASDPLLLLLGIVALSELFPKRRTPFAGLVFFALIGLWTQAILVLLKNDAAVRIEGLSWIFCAAIAAIVIMRRMNTLAAGFFVLNFFPAISGRMSVLLHGGWLRMVPVFSLAAAYLLWIRWARSLDDRQLGTIRS